MDLHDYSTIIMTSFQDNNNTLWIDFNDIQLKSSDIVKAFSREMLEEQLKN